MAAITFEEFKRIEIKIGKVISVEKVENADKLLKLTVDFGPDERSEGGRLRSDSGDKGGVSEANTSRDERQIVSGIAEFYQPDELEGKKLPFIVNLEPRTFKGVESQGMLMAVAGDKPVLLLPAEDVAEGSEIV